MSHHDFRHSGRENQGMGYMGVSSAMMNDHGIMGQMESHMMSGGDAYSPHHMMQIFADPNMSNMSEMQEGEYK